MDKTKINQRDKIYRAISKELLVLGFARTRTTFWTKENLNTIQFIHIHSMSFDYSFRIHCGIRVKNDSFDAASLNGLTSNDGWWEKPELVKKRKELNYTSDIASIKTCSESIIEFIKTIGIPWFELYADDVQLLENQKSPLKAEEKLALLNQLNGDSIHENELLSKKIMGIKN